MNLPNNIILIVADSLRFDSVYNNNAAQMPYFEQHATQFLQARSSGCWTLPGTASLFTGLMPHEHGATSQTRFLKNNIPTLAEKLKSIGYKTLQVTANVATTDIFGLDRGFDEIHKTWKMVDRKYNWLQLIVGIMGKPRMRKMLLSKDILVNKMTEDFEIAKSWLQLQHQNTFEVVQNLIAANEQKKQRSFIFVNLMETHFPYHIDETFKLSGNGLIEKIKEGLALYHTVNQTFLKKDNFIIKADILKILRNRQQKSWDIIAPNLNDFAKKTHQNKNNLLVFCSDHGDNFGEQDWLYHFSNVTDAGNRVPLMWLPAENSLPQKINTPINSKDIHHQILYACGIKSTNSPIILNEPQNSYPIMQSFWYNNKEKTLQKYKYNQFAFVVNNQRFVNRNQQWLTAPVATNEPEPHFKPLNNNINPIFEAVSDEKHKNYLLNTLNNFTQFSNKVGTGNK